MRCLGIQIKNSNLHPTDGDIEKNHQECSMAKSRTEESLPLD